METTGAFRESILELDKTHYDGVIARDENFNVIQVGIFKVGELATFTTPVRTETQIIERFEGQWAIFSGGRVEISHLAGWKINPAYDEYSQRVIAEYQSSIVR